MMSDVEIQDNNDPLNGLEVLKKRADLLGIKYHPNIGIDALREKVQKAMAKEPESSEPKVTGVIASKHTEAAEREEKHNMANRLIRAEIVCMNPNKREWQGEIFTVANSKIGTIKKFVPFNVPFHIPQAILNMIKERQCQIFETVKDSRGNKSRKGKLIKEFGVNILDPLTDREIKELAAAQAAAGTIDR